MQGETGHSQNAWRAPYRAQSSEILQTRRHTEYDAASWNCSLFLDDDRMLRFWNSRLNAGGTVLAWAFLGPFLPRALSDDSVQFERDVAPILITRCLECHHAGEATGGLVLATAAGLSKGGESGAAVVPGKAAQSLLVQRIEAGEMPPPKKGHSAKLPDGEIQILRRWIESGASWPQDRILDLYERTSADRAGRDWWSLQPIQRPSLPNADSQSAGMNAIDSFIADRLSRAGLSMAPRVDRRTLIRRLYTDLVGLPPTAEETDAFEKDPAPDAYERLVDRLLNAPQFGERWARYWLDVVRFAETCGYERDQVKPNAWKYRDWIVDCFNRDYAYDRFVRDQVCGDELPDRTIESVIATGFLRLGTWNDEPNDAEEYKYDRLEDLVDTTCSAFLGLTVKCARCHDHKFDPIYQADYYRVANVFWPGPIEARDAKLLGGPSPTELGFDVLGWTDVRTDAPPMHLLKKGDPRRPGAIVGPGNVSFVAKVDPAAPAGDAKSTRRRSQLADWMLDTRNPLPARVIANRLWQHHFGQGLVRTPSNFGFTGDRPTHPELLDWLANELVGSGWSLKHIHRLIVCSATYQQSSLHPQHSKGDEQDPENRLWWRSSRRRLDAESLRDAMLLVSGDIDLRMGGPSFRPTIAADALEGLSRKSAAWTASPSPEQRRRSLYIFTQRSLLPPLMTTFDFVDTTLPCPKRDVTIAAPQALALFNNEFAHERSTALARRVTDMAGSERIKCIHTVWQLALGRRPNPMEVEIAQSHLAAQEKRFATLPMSDLPGGSVAVASLASLCHVLLNCNEFAFVD